MFYDVFCKLCTDNGLTPSGAASKIGFNRASVTVWKNTGRPPKPELLDKIAAFFDVSTDYLLEKTTKEKPAATEDSGISQELFERADERPSTSFLYTLSIGAAPAFASYDDYLTDDKLFVFQSNTIRELAKQGPCVFIGRCADYVLRQQPGMLSVFIHAPLEQRVLRVARLYNIDEDKARARIRKTDKTRANYYNYYADGDWGRADRYDIALNTGKLPIPIAAQLLADAAKLVK